ncbi:glucan biosynthesis protein [Paenibacillus zeisoli]|uniref:Glucan biosynthesis protein n=1 Tax=Paenibacillus zeisoli TaxID=2496267 RepID=A0A3S1B7V9_9BACL|nr:SMI1/KNR4 family protein [Paenibacillus zeisoli]RUT31885.1 glucan biosynthesis protein [Paenibacillus zeisoli]
MDQNLIKQLNQWHEEDKHQQIVDTLQAIPEEERDYEVVSRLARAYNNLERYEEALEQFALIAEPGQQDPLWHYRVGYALYYLRRYEEAAQAFSAADKLEPGDPDTEWMLKSSLRKAGKQLREEQRIAAKRAAAALEPTGTSGDAAPFTDEFLNEFWEDSDYARKSYVSEPPTDEMIASVEDELGYKLPASYIALMKQQNGGIPKNTCFPTDEATSWAEDHIAITSIMGIGREKSYSLCGDTGSLFMIEEWGYPDIGVVICDCPSAGHDVVMLDYRASGPDGEPSVIHVDQESDYEITFLAEDFETFIKGLVNEEEFDTSEEDKEADLHRVATGEFSPLLKELCSQVTEVPQIESTIRRICTRIVEDKGHFSFHNDPLSYLMYDVQFWLYTKSHPDTGRQQYLDVYPSMIAFGGEFSQGGYAPGWITDWLDQRICEGSIAEEQGRLSLTAEAQADLIRQLEQA